MGQQACGSTAGNTACSPCLSAAVPADAGRGRCTRHPLLPRPTHHAHEQQCPELPGSSPQRGHAQPGALPSSFSQPPTPHCASVTLGGSPCPQPFSLPPRQRSSTLLSSHGCRAGSRRSCAAAAGAAPAAARQHVRHPRGGRQWQRRGEQRRRAQHWRRGQQWHLQPGQWRGAAGECGRSQH